MSELRVFGAAIADREAFERIHAHVDVDELSPQGKAWWPLVTEWYKIDPAAGSVDRAQLRERAKKKLPEKHFETLVGWFDQVPEVSAANVVQDLLDSKLHVSGNRLCGLIQSGDKAKIAAGVEAYSDLLRATTLGQSNVTEVTVEDMLAVTDRGNLIGIAPEALNKKCKGGAAPGDHILIFGRTESGKTLCAVNMVGGFLKFGHKVLYIANEENPGKTMARVVCNLSGATADQFAEDPERAIAVARERGFDHLLIRKMDGGTLAEVEDLVREHQPKVVVLDQIRNLTVPGPAGTSMVTKLEQLGIGFRTILSKYGVVGVSITQARDTETEDPWLDTEHIDNSRTGLPGTCDLIIGIGWNDELKATQQRAISLCKNKLNDDPDGRVGFIVQIDTSRSRMR